MLCEILDDTAIGPTASSCSSWPASTSLQIISIEELIRYRRVREKLVYRMAEAEAADAVRPVQADHRYGVKYESQQPFVLVMGDLDEGRRAAGAAALVVLHRRLARLAALRLRRPVAHGPGDDRPAKGPACWSICRRKGAASA